MSAMTSLTRIVGSRSYGMLAAALGLLIPLVWTASLLNHPEEAVKIRNGEMERARPVRWASGVSRSLEQATALALGIQPAIRIYPRGTNERDLRELFQARNRFLMAVAASCLAALVFGLQLVALLKRPGGRAPEE